MIEVRIPPVWREIAQQKASELGVLKNSIRDGEGNGDGILGELAFLHVFGGIWASTSHYDIIKYQGTVDVKTKRTTVRPEPHHFGSVAAFNPNQNCDFYYFARINEFQTTVWLMGGLAKARFFAGAQFFHQGDLDPTSSPRCPFYFTADCYNRPYSELQPGLFPIINPAYRS